MARARPGHGAWVWLPTCTATTSHTSLIATFAPSDSTASHAVAQRGRLWLVRVPWALSPGGNNMCEVSARRIRPMGWIPAVRQPARQVSNNRGAQYIGRQATRAVGSRHVVCICGRAWCPGLVRPGRRLRSPDPSKRGYCICRQPHRKGKTTAAVAGGLAGLLLHTSGLILGNGPLPLQCSRLGCTT